MDLTYATIVILACMIFVLSAMVGYLYWQQTRLQQHINSLGLVVSSLVQPAEPEPEPEPEVETEPVVEEEEEEEDDRLSVEHISAPPTSEPDAPTATEPSMDVDELPSKTASQLRDMLTAKGIPFSKRDSKTTLIELLKATA